MPRRPNVAKPIPPTRCWLRPLLYFAVVFCASALFSPAFSGDSAAPDNAPLRHIVPRIVKVRAQAGDGAISVGSGVPIAHDQVATSCHVTVRAHRIDVVAFDADGPRVYQAIAQSSSISQDLCILQLGQRMTFPPVRLGPPPALGDAVVAIGYSGGRIAMLHFGEVLGRFRHDGADVLETSTEFDRGASGGGLFTRSGDLVGLVTFRSYGPKARYFVIPIQWIAESLVNRPFEPIAPLTGQPFWQRDEALLPAFLREPETRQSTRRIEPRGMG